MALQIDLDFEGGLTQRFRSLTEVCAAAVFDNGDRQVVILQRGLGGPETDLQIFVPFDRLGDLIKALQKQLPEE